VRPSASITAVVKPCVVKLGSVPKPFRIAGSMCSWRAKNPGVTYWPEASTTRAAGGALQVADRGDAVAGDPDVGIYIRIAGAVQNAAVPDHHVEAGRLSRRQRRDGQRQGNEEPLHKASLEAATLSQAARSLLPPGKAVFYASTHP
jgi:hypothetical protein